MTKIHARLEATPLVAISSYCASLPDGVSGFGLLLGRYHRNSWTITVACVGPVSDLSSDFAYHLKHLRHLARLEIDVHAGLQVAGLFVMGGSFQSGAGGQSSDGVDLGSGVTLDSLVQLAFDEFLLRLEPECDPLLVMVETKQIILGDAAHRVLDSVRALTPDCHPPVSFNSRSDRVSFDSVSLEVSPAPEEAIAAFSVVRGLVVHNSIASSAEERIAGYEEDKAAVEAASKLVSPFEPLFSRSAKLARIVALAERFRAAKEGLQNNGCDGDWQV